MTADYDVLIIGSGFGGSVSALRLAEKGYRVGVFEAGRRFDTPGGGPAERHRDLPKTSWRMFRYVWAPGLGMTGIQRLHLVRGDKGSRVMVLAGAGVGGGSLVYANTLYEPLQPFFDDPQWKHITDWRAELAPYYDQAKRMLGVVWNPTMTPADEAIQRVANRMGRGETFHRTQVGVHFGERPGEETPDPYFGGAGPRRRGCVECGACMTGCRHGAKNMLTENYLYLAEKAGAEVLPLTRVTSVRPLETGGYEVRVARTASPRRHRRTLTAEQVVFAAGTYGTQKLLHTMKAQGRLPHLSDRLGVLTRTNSEALLGAERRGRRGDDHSRGLAITSSFHPTEDTHVEPVRYGRGSNAMGLLRSLLIDGPAPGGGRPVPRWARFLGHAVTHPWDLARLVNVRGWSERTVIALVMQVRDNSITTRPRRGLFGWSMRAGRGHGEPNPVWIPEAHEATRLLAEETGGIAGGTWLDLFDIPMTAHFIGGCAIGASAEDGVIDPYHRVYGHDGLHIVDGSTVSANLGVNPSLTITAQAERAMSLWPNRGEADPRPPLGSDYRRLAPVPPAHPVVPTTAPAALHLPITPVGPITPVRPIKPV
ncbi:GMC oxidoreductase [Actinomadura sp. HBU206391]|uniref:GMC oxidoreductase n=1 Tax=Actinomadura sp. HBU206391 TaxID=2731692 RepID=UPI00164F41C2|nr:GMC family oxidoreductase [Actinomadura sp. HBU206391]MBC6456970.1 GMC family oxidoreductase [Actinomadura sp. HBU206391]